MKPRRPSLAAFWCCGLLTGCSGIQSALDPAGREAAELATLFKVLLVGAVILWLLVNGTFFYVTRLHQKGLSKRLAETMIIGGGIVFPVIVLGALLGYSLSLMPHQRAPGSGLTIKVKGEQWWWRVEYWPDGAREPIVSANEIRLPVNRRTEIRLSADKVIHSFWIPALAGKLDMFPGRETRMALEPLKAGVFRGQCAEFCGTSHALMAFQAVTMPEEDFALWLDQERLAAAIPESAKQRMGQAVFLEQGCGGCHTIRGTEANGVPGPDLTHVGSRQSLGAGILPPTAEAFARWVRHAGALKPDAAMPSYEHLADSEIDALAHYLEGLK